MNRSRPVPSGAGSGEARPIHRTSLTLKMILLTVLVGGAVWALLDLVQTRALKKLFQAQLTERLGQGALEDRLNFDRYIKAHNHLVRILVSRKQFLDYLQETGWTAETRAETESFEEPPPWFPRLASLRTFAQPRLVLLLDGGGTVREIFKLGEAEPPPSLRRPTKYLINMSHDQSFFTSLDGAPYIVTSESVRDESGAVTATLMLASPLDDLFLTDSQGVYRGRLIAIVMGDDFRIVTSSDLTALPSGMPIKALEEQFIVTGQEFYEYGDSELAFSFASFVSTEEVDALTGEIVSKERRQRALMAFAVILGFAFLMVLVTRRIDKLTRGITAFSEEVCYELIEEDVVGDQLDVLEGRFRCLMRGIVSSQNIIRNMFSSYVSPKVVDELLINPEKARLGAERRDVTILFADLMAFTRLTEELPPEEVVSMLNEYFGAMTEVVFRWDGTFDKIVGDEIMAFWGAPLEQPNHAELAVRCALHMESTLAALNRKWEGEGKKVLECGIGINTGSVLVGNIGAEGRKMDYTSIGDPVNTASRVEALTREYEGNILLTEFTAAEIRPLIENGSLGHARLIERGHVKVKGKETKVRIHELRETQPHGASHGVES